GPFVVDVYFYRPLVGLNRFIVFFQALVGQPDIVIYLVFVFGEVKGSFVLLDSFAMFSLKRHYRTGGKEYFRVIGLKCACLLEEFQRLIILFKTGKDLRLHGQQFCRKWILSNSLIDRLKGAVIFAAE